MGPMRGQCRINVRLAKKAKRAVVDELNDRFVMHLYDGKKFRSFMLRIEFLAKMPFSHWVHSSLSSTQQLFETTMSAADNLYNKNF